MPQPTQPSEPARIGIVIVTFDPPATMLERCVEALFVSIDDDHLERTVDVYIVDNGGHAEARLTDARLTDTRWESRYRLIRTENHGFGAAVNVGFAAASAAGAQVLVCLNDDAFVEPGWLPPLLSALDADARLGAVQPLLVSADGESVGSAGITIDEYGQGSDLDVGRTVASVPTDGPRPVVGVTAGAAAYRAGFIDDVGTFDERFFLYYEDVELCRRGASHGWRFAVVPGSRVRHAGSASTTGLGDRRLELQERNRLWDSAMWGTPGELARAVWLSTRRLRHEPRAAHRRALVAGIRGIAPRLVARTRNKR